MRIAIGCAVVVFVAGCTGNGFTAGDASVSFVTPLDGATVVSPVVVHGAVVGLELVPAGSDVPDGVHLHVLVDVVCVPAGRTIPADDRHLHLGDGSASVAIELEPGQHALCLQAGGGEHEALPYFDVVTIEVAP